MVELNRAQLQAWDSSLQMASLALDDPDSGPARLRSRLRNALSALRESVASVRRLGETVAGLRRELLAERARLSSLREQLPTPYLVTTADGTILLLNQAASAALNVSARSLVGRNLLIFLDNREGWMQALAEVMRSRDTIDRGGNLRPRERLQFPVVASLSVADMEDAPAIQWFFQGPHAERAGTGARAWPSTPASRPSTPSSA